LNNLAMALTDEKCKQNDNILTYEIELDIKDTQREIDQYQNELDALIGDRQGNRLAIYMREGKINNRREFVSNLKSILEYRNTLNNKL